MKNTTSAPRVASIATAGILGALALLALPANGKTQAAFDKSARVKEQYAGKAK